MSRQAGRMSMAARTLTSKPMWKRTWSHPHHRHHHLCTATVHLWCLIIDCSMVSLPCRDMALRHLPRDSSTSRTRRHCRVSSANMVSNTLRHITDVPAEAHPSMSLAASHHTRAAIIQRRTSHPLSDSRALPHMLGHHPIKGKPLDVTASQRYMVHPRGSHIHYLRRCQERGALIRTARPSTRSHTITTIVPEKLRCL